MFRGCFSQGFKTQGTGLSRYYYDTIRPGCPVVFGGGLVLGGEGAIGWWGKKRGVFINHGKLDEDLPLFIGF